MISRIHFHLRLFWILFWLFGIIYTGYAVYQDTNHYLDYPSMILRKEESLGEFNNFATWMLVTDFFITNHIVENLNDSSCIFLERTSFPRLYLCSNSLHSRMKIRQKYPQITGKLCQNFQFMIRSHIIWNI